MFILKEKCQFKISKVVFTVPKDYYIEVSNTDLDNNMLCFSPPDKSFVVCYRLVCNSKKIRDVMDIKYRLLIFLSLLYAQYQPSQKIEHNGLIGYCTTYGDEKEQYYEARFLIDEPDSDIIEFEFSILTYNGDIERIKKSPEFKELFDGIQNFIRVI